MEKNYSLPIYHKIALDIANKINIGEIQEGTLLRGRSSLAGTYNVSPETIRRSMKILEDLEVVSSVKGKGIWVLSSQKALSFLNKHQNITNISSYKSNLNNLLISRSKLESEIIDNISKIVDYSSRLSNINPLIPFEFEITKECKFIGSTASDTNFWQHTGATIVGIKRDGELIVSPGPYIEFKENDLLLVVGDSSIHHSVPAFLY
ncbi:TrkA C-terminal domain-containing protein [Romboutsia sedimentorum]|jgi:K+/H+ antiporter YhaU regulatory subunit KhtT|uniref:TrkA C-terminal domain-containing protein n=1 Tax=Romboutsia sedimentorum TaxID=1368474 RepID=A0ABT7E825_9FIRM|nr:TrkA C-terminal domain-containing protein [Romboutsia sedimentorum]MDK2563037.1 TrkA C-terminal domain-containing protein [Romboutsia sedimentorum]MDK2586242.1 TrkA C-terminal domain-containing protein [Romboutsia sedimentorum]